VNVEIDVSDIGAQAPKAESKRPRILLFGDSHSNAIQRAIEKRQGKGTPSPIVAYRLLKEKNGRSIGDMRFEDFLDKAAKLGREDVVLSMIGGNQHAVFSTVQHPQPFDFFAPGQAASAGELAGEIVPYRALEHAFVNGLERGDAQSLTALRKATVARVVHIIPPPPKHDNAHIQQYHESHFANDGLASRGVSPPELRLKFWNLQTRVLESLCSALGIEVMMPPARTVDENGFLRREYYAQDATHANWRYGERLLREVERRFLPAGPSPQRRAA
jgi:hypothetical protein